MSPSLWCLGRRPGFIFGLGCQLFCLSARRSSRLRCVPSWTSDGIRGGWRLGGGWWWMMVQWVYVWNNKQAFINPGKKNSDLTRVFTPNGGLVWEIALFQENLGWWNLIIWPDKWMVFYMKIWNHPIETTICKWLFGVPGMYLFFFETVPATNMTYSSTWKWDGFQYDRFPFGMVSFQGRSVSFRECIHPKTGWCGWFFEGFFWKDFGHWVIGDKRKVIWILGGFSFIFLFRNWLCGITVLWHPDKANDNNEGR